MDESVMNVAEPRSPLQRHARRVRCRLNVCLFLERFTRQAVAVCAVVALLTVLTRMAMGRAFAVGPAFAAGAGLLAVWAAWQAWRQRYGTEDALAYMDLWQGGKGELLMGRWPVNEQDRPLWPVVRWRRLMLQLAPSVCIVVFAFQTPVRQPPREPGLVWQNTQRLAQRLEQIEKLAVLPPEKRRELMSSLEQFQETARQMSTEEFWQTSDRFEEAIDKALAESQAAFDGAAQVLEHLAAANTAGEPQAAGKWSDAIEALSRQSPQLAALDGSASLPPELARKLAELLQHAQAGDVAQLEQAMRQLTEQELRELIEKLRQCSLMAGQCRSGGDRPGLSLEGMMLGGLQSGRGGVDRGPATNNRLFGEESPELSGAMQDALLPASPGGDPGVLVDNSQIPSTPQVDRSGWNQPASGAAPVAIGEQTGNVRHREIAPRYRDAVGNYFSDAPAD
jgi:hypothetical protein